MPLGLVYDGMAPLKDFLPLINYGEECGLDSIWIAEHLLYREAFVVASYILQKTESLKIIPGPISPYLMHPAVISMFMSTFSEYGKDRFGLLLGTGDMVVMDYLGVEVTRPLSTMEEAIKIIRMLCRGEEVSATGFWKMHNVRLHIASETKIPIYLTGIGPNMLSLAYRMTDGVVLSAAISPKFIRHSLDLVPIIPVSKNNFKRIGFVLASVHNSRRKAIEQIKPKLAFMLRGSRLRADWELNGLKIDGSAIKEALDIQHDINAACNYLQEIDVETLTAVGTPTTFQSKLQEYLFSGIDYPVILPVGNRSDQIRAIELAIEVCG